MNRLERSIYARVFGPDSKNWTEDNNINMMYLRAEESYFNCLLINNKYVLLRDIYKRLDLDTHISYENIGWVYDPRNEFIDNYISFGLDQIGASDSTLVLDFNVDGIINIDTSKRNKD